MPERFIDLSDVAAPATGAAFGVIALYSRLGNRPVWQKFILLLSAFVGAMFTGWAAKELWDLSPGVSGAISWLAGNVALQFSETAVALVSDVPWIQRQLAALIPGKSKDDDNA